MSRKEKHVIFLGAGASVTSGYPTADKLRLLMSSEQALKRRISEIQNESIDLDNLAQKILGGPIKEAINLFRHGCFSSVDEFSALARLRYPKEVQSLKKLLRTALSLHNPESEFEKSDYYIFVQRLFHRGLFPLRNDVSILTFNYDPYLPYLLDKANNMRAEAGGNPNLGGPQILTSGFDGRVVGQLEDAEGFCFLQLHGSVAWPQKFEDEPAVCYTDLFNTSLDQRLKLLCDSRAANSTPPIAFPWEVIDEKGGFIEQERFCLAEDCDDKGRRQGAYIGAHDLYQLFTSIWKRARKEINRATKISFVGLSMHEFLTPALRFLFAERSENAQIVCATKEHEQFRSVDDVEAHRNPRSPTYRLRRMLKKVCPAITGFPNRGDHQIWLDGGATVRVRETFSEFTNEELWPVGAD